MRKKIFYLLIMAMSCVNTNSNNEEIEEYYKIKEKYMKKNPKNEDIEAYIEFYNNYKKEEIKKIKLFLINYTKKVKMKKR